MKLKDCKKYYDYIPITLIALLFIAEESDMHHHAIHNSCQICINIISIVVFYCIILHYEKSKVLAFVISLIIWIVLIYIKDKHLL
jgi:hypothetical protein